MAGAAVAEWFDSSTEALASKNSPRLFIWAENSGAPGEFGGNVNSQENGESRPEGVGREKLSPTIAESRGGHGNQDKQGGGRARVTEARRLNLPSHPGQMQVGPLRQFVRQLATANELNSLPATANVWLPSQNGLPQTRLGLFQKGVNALAGDNAPDRLMQWQVTGLTLEPFHTLAFLSRFPNQRYIEISTPNTVSPPYRGGKMYARLGNDLLFWSHAAKFVLEALAGQQFLPALIPDQNGRFQALWQPLLLDFGLRGRLESLVAAMPPICRAYELKSLDEAPSSGTILEQFIGVLVDQAVRAWAPGVSGALVGRALARQDQHPADNGRDVPVSSARHWVEGLAGEQPLLQLPPQPAHQLYQQWLEWREQLQSPAADSNFNVAFALELHSQAESPSHIPDWRLRYFLQDRDDPELLIPAQKIWAENGHSIRVDGRRFDQPQERLLTGLGIASRMFAPIRESLRTPRPESAILSMEDAYLFLKEIGPLLESSGFGVVTPDWWAARSRSRLGLRLRLLSHDAGGMTTPMGNGHQRAGRKGRVSGRTPQAGLLPTDGLIQFRWELTLGNQTLSREEFEHLANLESPLVRIHDEWVELDPEQVAAARQFIDRNQTAGRMTLLEAVKMAQAYAQEGAESVGKREETREKISSFPNHGENVEAEQLPLEAVVVDGWLDIALERLRGMKPIEEIHEPEGFIGTLRPYQRRGVGWLWFLRRLGLGACLADDMGLGKTIQAIALLLYSLQRARIEEENGSQAQGSERQAAAAARPALLICPTSVVANWRHEIERFAPSLRLLLHHGSGRLNGDEFRAALSQHDLVVTSFGIARRDVELLSAIEWSDLILDEAQNIKNPAAKQTQAVRWLKAQNRIALTGTPVENRLLELWSIMEFLNPDYLGNRERFRQQFVLPIERYNSENAAAELRQLAQPFLLRRLKTDPSIITDLPEKNEMIVYCSLTQEQEALYNQVIEETMARVENSEGVRRRGLVLSLLLKLKQVTNHPAHYLREQEPLVERSGKLTRLTEMLEEALSIGDRALVFTQFVEMGHLLRRHLMETLGQEALFLHGGTPASKREQMVRFFQEDKVGAPIFLLSLRAGGVGLNLTRANHVFHFDRWWNPAVENQATDRAFRIGQKRSVQVYKFVVAGTLEEQIHKMIESKQNLAESIVNSGEDWLADMDSDGLRQLIALRR